MARSKRYVILPRKIVTKTIQLPGGLTAEQIAALELAPAADYDFPANANMPVPSGLTALPASGWAVIRFVQTALGGTQTLWALNSGNTTNSFGLRISSSTNRPQILLRANSVDLGSAIVTSQLTSLANVVEVAGLSWKREGGTLFLRLFWHGQIYEASISDPTFTTAFSSLNIGGRNGGLDALTGRVAAFQIGSGSYLTGPQLGAICSKSDTHVITTGGQSNIARWMSGSGNTNTAGRNAFLTTSTTSTLRQNLFLGGAVGGASVRKANAPVGAPDNYWWNEDTNSPGPNALAWQLLVETCGRPANSIKWDQIEAESHKVGNPLYPLETKASYKGSLTALFNWVRTVCPRMYIDIAIGGVRTDGTYTNTNGIQTIVDVQIELIAENEWCRFSHERYDLALDPDGVHEPDASYATAAARSARNHDRYNGASITGTQGMRFGVVTRSGTALTIDFLHDGGTDFTPASGFEGLTYIDNSGNVIPMSGLTKASGSRITATLGSAVPGTLYSCYDNYQFTSLSNIIRDNTTNTLPIRRGKVSVA